jgi:endonuclease/exonuclease/phosphatase (EEP) superfamily protein YafD
VARDADGIPRIEAELALDARRHVKLTALHPMPPLSPHFHATRDQALRDLARSDNALDMPSILAGDLNATPWSTALSGLDALGWRRATGLRPTWPASGQGLLGIPIDHVLASRHWRVEGSSIGPDIGSDHRPTLVRLVLAGGGPPPLR